LGHTLVIPKVHYIDIFDIPEKELAVVHKVSKLVSFAVKKQPVQTELVLYNKMEKLRDKIYSTFMCMWFRDLKGKSCRLSAN
jgi:diadenosine tetraphosphate (Ap4A) HIT family hydrolase